MAITLKHPKPVTDDEILELSRLNPGYRFERTAEGELIVTPTGGESGRRENALNTQLYAWAERDGRGVTFSPSTMFILPDGSRFMPDASWVPHTRYHKLSKKERRGWLPLCPNAAFEIASPNDSVADLREKVLAYLANGAELTVLIDPDERVVEVHRPQQEPETHRNPSTVALDPELPGFVLVLEPIFAT